MSQFRRRCQKLLPGGEVCGQFIGRCIHSYIPTKFGARPQADVKTTENTPKRDSHTIRRWLATASIGAQLKFWQDRRK